MTTPDLRSAGRAFLQRWNDYFDAHPDAENDTAVLSAMSRGELPPETAVYQKPVTSLPDLSIKELSPAWTAYQNAIRDGWKPKQAAYIAWAVHPASMRKDVGLPETADAMARALGSKAKKDPGNMFRNWRRRYPTLDQYIFEATRDMPLAHYRAALINTAVQTGLTPGKDGTTDRWKLLEMTGDYNPGAKGTEDDPVHVAHPGIESALDRIYSQPEEGAGE